MPTYLSVTSVHTNLPHSTQNSKNDNTVYTRTDLVALYRLKRYQKDPKYSFLVAEPFPNHVMNDIRGCISRKQIALKTKHTHS